MEPNCIIAGKYRVIRPLGEGGMAEVWAAQNLLTDRQFAIKLVLPSLAMRPDIVERFLQEARATGRLKHPAIVDVFDVGQAEDGRPFMVMELLKGSTLDQRIRCSGALDPLTASVLMARVARALVVAHRAGVVHRDLSSANVFLVASRDGKPWPKILDFGVSKLMGPREERVRTDSGSVMGSPDYMSPEQAQGSDLVDERTDVWALGVLLYESLTGRTPFVARNYNALMLAIMTVPHCPVRQLRPDVPVALCNLIESCLIKDPAARLASAADAAATLDAISEVLAAGRDAPGPRRRAADRLPLPSQRPPQLDVPEQIFSPAVRAFRRMRRQRGSASVLIAALSTLLGVGIGSAWSGAAARAPSRAPSLHAGIAPTSLPPPRVAAEPMRAPPTRVAETDLVRAAAQGLGLARRHASGK